MPKIYLISPGTSTPTYFGAESHEAYGFPRAALLADLALTTVAALVPPDFEVHICDEHVSTVDFDTDADFIGITGKVSQEERMFELAREFQRRGKTVIFGGPFATLCADLARPHCDVLVRGEIENIAERFFGDLRAGKWEREYIGDRPDPSRSPLPRWDLYPNERVISGELQTSRGCPFECEFCDVTQYLGRGQRFKTTGQVLEELEALYRHGYRNVLLADDNFTADYRRAKGLLQSMRDWNDRRREGRVTFSIQASIDCARDEELLRLCAEAGVGSAFVGIETPNSGSLKETRKRQNLGVDLVAQIKRLTGHGMLVIAGMMVGFDSDSRDIFEQQYEFAMSSPIPMFTVAMLVAPLGTSLYRRLDAERRIMEPNREVAGVLPWGTNIRPRQMSLEELQRGMRWLCNRLYRAEAFGDRVIRFIDCFEPPAPRPNTGSRGEARAVDTERVLVAGRVLRLGAEEGEMIQRISKRLESKPAAAGYVLSCVAYYVQIRHMYATAGLWDADLGRLKKPL